MRPDASEPRFVPPLGGVAAGEQSSAEPVKVLICGAGPAGLLLAHFLLGPGGGKFRVAVYDKAEDPREDTAQGLNKRSYTIGISKRGENSMNLVPGLLEKVKKVIISPDCFTVLLPLMTKPVLVKQQDSGNWVVDRSSLCSSLLAALLDMRGDEAQRGLLSLHFRSACVAVDLQRQEATFQETPKEGAATPPPVMETYDLLVGADGLRSVVRQEFQKQIRNFEVDQRVLAGTWTVAHFDCPPGYSRCAFHMFPLIPKSGGMSGLAMPAPDGSLCFVVGLPFLDEPEEWLHCSTPEEAHKFLSSRLPYFNIPEEAAWKLRSRPPQSSMQVKCWQYHDTKGHAVLIGDAAHATAPSIGQGCNAALVDASVLGRLLLGEALGPGDRAPDVRAYQIQRRLWAKDPSPDEIRARLPALLSHFSALQVREGHALVDVSDANWPISAWAKILHSIFFLTRLILSTVLPFLVDPPVMGYAGRTTTPYSKIYDKFHWETDLMLWANGLARRSNYAKQAAAVVSKNL